MDKYAPDVASTCREDSRSSRMEHDQARVTATDAPTHADTTTATATSATTKAKPIRAYELNLSSEEVIALMGRVREGNLSVDDAVAEVLSTTEGNPPATEHRPLDCGEGEHDAAHMDVKPAVDEDDAGWGKEEDSARDDGRQVLHKRRASTTDPGKHRRTKSNVETITSSARMPAPPPPHGAFSPPPPSKSSKTQPPAHSQERPLLQMEVSGTTQTPLVSQDHKHMTGRQQAPPVPSRRKPASSPVGRLLRKKVAPSPASEGDMRVNSTAWPSAHPHAADTVQQSETTQPAQRAVDKKQGLPVPSLDHLHLSNEDQIQLMTSVKEGQLSIDQALQLVQARVRSSQASTSSSSQAASLCLPVTSQAPTLASSLSSSSSSSQAHLNPTEQSQQLSSMTSSAKTSVAPAVSANNPAQAVASNRSSSGSLFSIPRMRSPPFSSPRRDLNDACHVAPAQNGENSTTTDAMRPIPRDLPPDVVQDLKLKHELVLAGAMIDIGMDLLSAPSEKSQDVHQQHQQLHRDDDTVPSTLTASFSSDTPLVTAIEPLTAQTSTESNVQECNDNVVAHGGGDDSEQKYTSTHKRDTADMASSVSTHHHNVTSKRLPTRQDSLSVKVQESYDMIMGSHSDGHRHQSYVAHRYHQPHGTYQSKRATFSLQSDQGRKKLLAIPRDLSSLLESLQRAFDVTPVGICTQKGAEILDLSCIRDDDEIIVLDEGPFKASCYRTSSLTSLSSLTSKTIAPMRASLAPTASNDAQLSDWVKLNVGGTTFLTTRATLTKEEGSMLAMMFSADGWNSSADDSGAFLFDRSPKYFEPLLSYLRDGTVVLDNGVSARGVYAEAHFFGLWGAVEILEPLAEKEAMELSANAPITREVLVPLLLSTASTHALRCQGLNFEGADLSCLDLRHVNFKLANLSNCDMRNCNLEYANLEQATLKNCRLDGSNLIGCSLSRARGDYASVRNCTFHDPTDRCHAVLEGSSWRNTDFEDSNLSKVNMCASSFKKAKLRHCNLRGSNLAGTDLGEADLSGCNFQGANLRGANTYKAMFNNT